MSHTPGPWYAEADDENESSFVWNREALPRKAVAHDIFNPADACLIAAAPDLLAACELAVAEMTETWPDGDWQSNFDTIRAAIAKAKGEA